MTIKLLCSINTYPRKKDSTFNCLKNTLTKLLRNIPDDLEIDILLIGDDYENIQELKPAFEQYDIKHTFININVNNALRNIASNKILKWQHSCTRSIIYALKYSIQHNYDNLIMFSDDDSYSPNYFEKITDVIKKYDVDLIFSLGRHVDKRILPTIMHENPFDNHPLPGNTIATGICFKSRNRAFINNLIGFLEKRMIKVMNNLHLPDIPQDMLMWEYLIPYFKNKKYTSYLIKEVLVFHDSEGTIFKNI